MANETQTVIKSGGIGFTGLLIILFVLLKVFGVVNWSWWLVFAPLWLPIAIVLAVIIVSLLVLGITFLVLRGRKPKRFKRI